IWLGATAMVVLVLLLMNRSGVFSLTPYLLVGIVLWYCVFRSGIHCTIAGVLLAFTIPTGSRVNLTQFVTWSREKMAHANENYDDARPISAQGEYLRTVGHVARVTSQVVPPATRLEHALHPWVYFIILPLFALTNADVSFGGAEISTLLKNPALLGCFFGLLLGKPVGIVGMSWILVKTKIAKLPQNVNWVHMIGAGILGGVGFTMAIFVANLAYTDPSYIATAKLGILSASALAGIIGFLFLNAQARIARRKGVVYLATKGDEAFAPTVDAHLTRQSAKILSTIESPLVRQEIEAAMQEGSGIAEVVVEMGSARTSPMGVEEMERAAEYAAAREEHLAAEAAAAAEAAEAEAAEAADAAEDGDVVREKEPHDTDELPEYVEEVFAGAEAAERPFRGWEAEDGGKADD
ncbi:MAG: Na+/H+ antiporter NhaA, partial [Eggerthellaceae bacterium]|nr:Na+/H+ antiporter NhaA [Eggerthellaceae bacterium]